MDRNQADHRRWPVLHPEAGHVIGNNSADASVVEAFGVDPATPVQKMGKVRILVRSLYPGGTDQSQLGREVARDALFTAFARRIAYLHSTKGAIT